MIKRTLYFSNPAYLKTQDRQLHITLTDTGEVRSVPMEDIGLVLLDHPQITLSHGAIARLLENNAALVTCNEKHHPTGLLLNLDGHSLQSQKFKAQVEASVPLQKQLWQQTVSAKIANQAALLKSRGAEHNYLLTLAKTVNSGDSENAEAKAASFYWKRIFPQVADFSRERSGVPPNNYLNYGYAILRALVARSLVGSGLLPTLGIHHRNQYNAYCLADDIMEPYRPFVDRLVCSMISNTPPAEELTTEHKKQLLALPTMDVVMEKQKSPLMTAVQRTTASLAKCFTGEGRKIVYPLVP